MLILAAALMSLGLFTVTTAADAALSWAWTTAGQRMVLDLSTVFHVRRPVGDSLSRLSQDTWSVHALASVLMSPGPCREWIAERLLALNTSQSEALYAHVPKIYWSWTDGRGQSGWRWHLGKSWS